MLFLFVQQVLSLRLPISLSIKIKAFAIKYKVTESSSSPLPNRSTSSSSGFSSFFGASSLGAATVSFFSFFSCLAGAAVAAAPHVPLTESVNFETRLNHAKTFGLASALGAVSLIFSYVSLSWAFGCYLRNCYYNEKESMRLPSEELVFSERFF